jgi:hypothetical protein
MFICSVRASTVKFFAFIFVAVALVIGVVSFSAGATVSASASGEVDFTGIKTKDDRLTFMSGLGIQVSDEEQSDTFVIPKNLDRVILGYNEIQKKQGLDVTKYTRKKITRYTYEVTNFNCEGKVYANLFVYRNRIIACDVSSLAGDGFVYPMTQLPEGSLK